MKKSLQITSLLATLLFSGCVSSMPNMFGSNLSQATNQELLFKTNQVHFMSTLKDNATQQERNAYMDEFLLKSDMQCQNFLNKPLQKPKVDKNKDSLYMSLFDSISSLFGISLVTNTAKAVFLNDDEESQEEKKAYANALTPEIRKGVEIGRNRFAKEMTKKKSLSLKAYSVNNLRQDLLKYDQQCNDDYGLIEINRALREMQSSMYRQTAPAPTAPTIDPKTIKAKVEEASKEVEKKKTELKTTPKLPKQPKPENVPVRHDNVPHSPRSIQI